MCGSMKEDLRFEFFEEVWQTGSIEDIGNERNDSVTKAGVDQFLLDLKKLHLALFDKQQFAGCVSSDLPAEFAADAATRAGNHDDAATKGALNFIAAELDL